MEISISTMYFLDMLVKILFFIFIIWSIIKICNLIRNKSEKGVKLFLKISFILILVSILSFFQFSDDNNNKWVTVRNCSENIDYVCHKVNDNYDVLGLVKSGNENFLLLIPFHNNSRNLKKTVFKFSNNESIKYEIPDFNKTKDGYGCSIDEEFIEKVNKFKKLEIVIVLDKQKMKHYEFDISNTKGKLRPLITIRG